MSRDEVSRFLRARGCPDDVVAGGIEGLVENWERTAEQVRAGYPLGLDDYLNDVDGRQLVEEVVAAVPTAASAALLERIESADIAMQDVVTPVDECLWGDALAEREGWTPGDNWWYFGLPREPGARMREELEDL